VTEERGSGKGKQKNEDNKNGDCFVMETGKQGIYEECDSSGSSSCPCGGLRDESHATRVYAVYLAQSLFLMAKTEANASGAL